jgi:hypothetical protein
MFDYTVLAVIIQNTQYSQARFIANELEEDRQRLDFA